MRRYALAAVCVVLAATAAAAAEGTVSLAPQGRQPRVAVRDGRLVAVVYGERDEIFASISRDGGRSYAVPRRVGSVEKLMLGMRRGPQVAATASGLVVTAIGKAGDLLAWRSADDGVTWSGPLGVNDSPRAAREGLHGLAAGAGDVVHVVWLDLRDLRTKLFASRSRDAGRSWEPNRLVYESPDGAVCECCQPAVAADDRNGVAVMWRNSLAGARDMFLIRSGDGGRSFGAARKLGAGSWPLAACPMDGGGLALAGETVASIWRREDTVYAAAAGGDEERLARGRNGAVAFGPRGKLMAWQDPDGDVLLQEPGQPPVAVGRGRFASLGSAPGGKGPVVLAWEDPERGAMARVVAPLTAPPSAAAARSR